MNILITGGTGYIGEHLVAKLLKDENKIRLLVRNITKATNLFKDKCEYFVGDITDKKTLIGCCKDIDIVYHMVAKVGNELPSIDNFEQFRAVNVNGTKNIVFEAKRSNVKRFIYVSTIAAMGIVPEIPISEKSNCLPYLPYQVSKYEAEQLLLEENKKNGFPCIILRPTKVYGIGEHEYSYLLYAKLCKIGIYPKLGNGKKFISNVYITDFVQSLLLASERGALGSIYIISSNDSISIFDSINVISNILKVNVHFISIPISLMVLFATLIETLFNKIGRKPPVTKSNILAAISDRVYTISKAKTDLGYEPCISMEDGIKLVVNWYIEQKLL